MQRSPARPLRLPLKIHAAAVHFQEADLDDPVGRQLPTAFLLGPSHVANLPGRFKVRFLCWLSGCRQWEPGCLRCPVTFNYWTCAEALPQKERQELTAGGPAKKGWRGPSPRQRFVYSAHDWPSAPITAHHGLSPPCDRAPRPVGCARRQNKPPHLVVSSIASASPLHPSRRSHWHRPVAPRYQGTRVVCCQYKHLIDLRAAFVRDCSPRCHGSRQTWIWTFRFMSTLLV